MNKIKKNPSKFNDVIQSVLSISPPNYEFKEWKKWEINLFRFSFIFLLLLIIPLDWKFYSVFFSIDWLRLNFHDLFILAKYQPQILTQQEISGLGITVFINWLIIAIVSLIGALLWSKFDKTSQEYTVLYYWLRVIVRYRLAVALIVYGFVKVFPLQMPYPSLSNLLTNYGDYYPWKIYFQTVGIAPNYESFLGFVEVLAGFLIFNRRTVTFGVGLVLGFIGNVAVVNGFYEIGEQVFSTFLVLLSVFLFVKDIPKLYNLLIKEEYTYANKFIPLFSDAFIRRTRRVFRYSFLFFVVLFCFKAYSNYKNDPYKIPKTPGLKNAYGYYNVKQFVINKDTIPYSKTDSIRWQDVVFEKWSTLSIKSNRPVIIDTGTAEAFHEKDIDRNYELAGLAGRHYFYYDADTVNHTLALQNKNIHHRNEKLFLKYSQPNDSTIILSGINETKDSINVVLEKIDKKYLMFEGRRSPVKL